MAQFILLSYTLAWTPKWNICFFFKKTKGAIVQHWKEDTLDAPQVHNNNPEIAEIAAVML
jgi:hypothetical protein